MIFHRFTSKVISYRPPWSKQFVAVLTPDRLRLYPPHIPILGIVGWIVTQLMGDGLKDASGTIIGSDFLAFFNAGKFYLSSNMEKLYDFYEQFLFQKSVVAPFDYTSFHPYINPPFTAPFFSIFAHGSYLTGLISWWFLGLSLILLSAVFFRREMSGLNNVSNLKLVYFSTLFFPTIAWFMYGQNTPISLFFYVAIFVLLRRKQEIGAGLFLGLLLFKPQLLLGPGLIVLLNRRWKVIVGATIGASAWLILGLISSSDAMLTYLKISPDLTNIIRLKPDILVFQHFPIYDQLNYPTWGVHSFFGFWSLLLDNISPKAADIAFIVTFIVGIAYLVKMWTRSPWEPAIKSWDFKMAASFALGLLLSPHLFTYDLMLLLLPIGILWSHYPSGTLGKPLDGASLLFWSALLYLVSFVGQNITIVQLKLSTLLSLPPFALQLSTLIIVGWVVTVGSASRKNNQ